MVAAEQRVVAVLALAGALRVAHWWSVREAPFFAQLAMDSQAYDAWARQIAAGDWLGSGAFFQAPLYPYLLAGVYRLFGPSYDAVYLLQIAVALAGLFALYRAGAILDGHALGLAAAAMAGGAGILVFHDVQLLKASTSVALSAGLLWVLLAARASPRARAWLPIGLILGLLVELRENALLLLPVVVLLARPVAEPRAATRRLAAAALGLAAVLAPFALRNLWVSGALLPTTFQGGTNFYIGNNPQADGTYQPIVAGKQIPRLERAEPIRIAEEALGRSLGPAEVSRYWWGQALGWAAEEPLAFAALQWKKLGLFFSFYEWPDAVDFYWTRTQSPPLRLAAVEVGAILMLAAAGLWMIRGELDRWAPVLLFAAFWTLSVVAFFVFSRYRLPVIPALALLAAVPVAGVARAWRSGQRPLLATTAILGACALPLALTPEPNWQLVHYNLGRLADERGDAVAARQHYLQALEANPRDFLSCLNLGTGAARRAEWEEAVRWFERAIALEPRSDDAIADLGSAYLAQGRLGEAEAALRRALAINGRHPPALHNLALLLARQGHLEEARALAARLLASAPEDPAALRLQRRLDRAEPAATPGDEEGDG